MRISACECVRRAYVCVRVNACMYRHVSVHACLYVAAARVCVPVRMCVDAVRVLVTHAGSMSDVSRPPHDRMTSSIAMLTVSAALLSCLLILPAVVSYSSSSSSDPGERTATRPAAYRRYSTNHLAAGIGPS